MLTDEQAEKALKGVRIKGRSKTFLAAIEKRQGVEHEVGLTILGRYQNGKKFNYWGSDKDFVRAGKQLDEMSASRRRGLFELLFGKVAPYVERAWEAQKAMPYQGRGYMSKAFRLPGDEAATREIRAQWLFRLHQFVAPYDQDIVWLATWHMHIAPWGGDCLGHLYAAALDAGGAESDRLLELFKEAAAGEHDIAMMGSHIPLALLSSAREDAWGFCEKLLLAAQRQEGLRQSILEVIDLAHPVAFRRMLKLILEENLVRFSSVVRAADVWFGLQWDSASPAVIKKAIATVVSLFDNEPLRREAIAGDDPEAAYMALWCAGFRDANEATADARRLLGHSDPAVRFAAAVALSRFGTDASTKALEVALADDDLRVTALALAEISGGGHPHLFDALEALLPRHPDKSTPMKPLVWPWMELTVGKGMVASALLENLGKRPITAILPYLSLLDTYERARVARELRKRKNQSPEGRDILLKLLKDPSPGVREEAVTGVKKFRSLEEDERLFLESLLTRQASDLRRGLLGILTAQGAGAALASAGRLLESNKAPQRVGGLELLRTLAESEQEVETCRSVAQAFEARAKRRTAAEETQLAAILGSSGPTVSLDDGLGLFDPTKLTLAPPPQTRTFKLSTPAAIAVLSELDALIHKNRKQELTVLDYDDKPVTLQLGNAGWQFPSPDAERPAKQQIDRWPLREIWEGWLVDRRKPKRDKDGLELFRALVMLRTAPPEKGEQKWVRDSFAKVYGASYAIPKLRYARIIDDVLSWFVELQPKPAMTDFVLDLAESELAALPLDLMVKCVERRSYRDTDKKKTDKKPLVRWDGWRDWCDSILRGTGALGGYQETLREAWGAEHDARAFRLLRWFDLPTEKGKKRVEGASRSRVDTGFFVRMWAAGEAGDDDALDHLIGPRGKSEWGDESFEGLALGTARRPDKALSTQPRFLEFAGRCRERVLEVELGRGDEPTPATGAAMAIASVPGAESLCAILKALGKATISRTYSYHNESKNVIFSELLRRTHPLEGDDEQRFSTLSKEAKVTESRLLQVALFAPQWAAHVEAALGWKGLAEAVWWIHAHTKDTHWSVDSDVREQWESQINERTTLSAEDLVDGAVDVSWFTQVYDSLKKARWEKLLAEARFASGGSGHKRAEVFAQAMLGGLKKTDMVKRINEKRHPDTVRALGLLPLARGKARDGDLLRRYQVFQEFVRTSRQFGSQRQATEKRAALIGQENLARTAGFADPIRLQWAMEAKEIEDMAGGEIMAGAGDVEVTLRIGEWGEVSIAVERNGKVLKNIPPAARKDKAIKKLTERRTALKRQASRSRKSLDAMMCRGDAITGGELCSLQGHPVLAPMLRGLVFVGEGGLIGYPAEGGKLLQQHSGKREVIGGDDTLRIAHPHDLFVSGEWHLWQHDCFENERVQPFKQIFREYYPMAADEKKGEGLSRRYAGHQINPSQAMALFGGRGWVAAPEEGVRLTDHKEDISAYVEFEETFYTPAEVEGLTVGGVRFVKRGSWESIAAPDVPPRLFSEVMRDIDLVVSVAHRGGVDPEASASTIEMRSQLITETVAVLKLDNVTLDGSHANIRGHYAEYNIHLGSAVTHMNPGGALFIVPVHAQHRGRLFLPFADDDPKTAEVLSKILLLARDREIQDPNILAQIRSLKS